MKAVWAMAVMLPLAACNDPGFRGVNGVRTATAAEVTSCAYISDIRIQPGVYGPILADQAVSYARNTLMADAQDAGANTVVFTDTAPGAPVYELKAKAYRC